MITITTQPDSTRNETPVTNSTAHDLSYPVIHSEVGDLVVIEICRRAPRDFYIEQVRQVTSTPYTVWIVRASTGLGIPDAHPMPVRHCITRHYLMAESSGSFVGFNFDPEVVKAIADCMTCAGEDVSYSDTHKFGVFFVKHREQDQIGGQTPRLRELLAVRIQLQ